MLKKNKDTLVNKSTPVDKTYLHKLVLWKCATASLWGFIILSISLWAWVYEHSYEASMVASGLWLLLAPWILYGLGYGLKKLVCLASHFKITD